MGFMGPLNKLSAKKVEHFGAKLGKFLENSLAALRSFKCDNLYRLWIIHKGLGGK